MESGNPKPRNWKEGLSDYQVVTTLMKRMGGKKGFDPMPPAQHQWQQAEGEPPLHRMWSWLCAHTIHWGHRSEYAVNVQGEELHIEHLAQDIGMDEANARTCWREGVQRGLWRNGTKAEGSRKLFLCGEVRPTATPRGEDEAKEKVCTNLLPPYILKQIKELAPEQQHEFWQEHETDTRLEKRAIAEVTAGVRLMFIQRQDTRYQRFGIKKIRERHPTKHGTPDQAGARQERLQGILPSLEGFVQTLLPFVQTTNGSLHNSARGAVQTSPTLLLQRLHRESPSSSSEAASTLPADKTTAPSHEEREAPKAAAATASASGPAALQSSYDAGMGKRALAKLPPPPERRVFLALSEAITPYAGTPDEPFLRRLVHDCRRAAPDCTVEDLVWVIHEKGPLARRGRDNPLAYLAKSVLNCFAGEGLQVIRSQRDRHAPLDSGRCVYCDQPIGDRSAINGMHHECWEKAGGRF